MQDMRECRRDGTFVRDILVGEESKKLKEQFMARAAELENRIESGETVKAEIRETRRIGRNDPCPCGSKVKFKKCCGIRFAKHDERLTDGATNAK